MYEYMMPTILQAQRVSVACTASLVYYQDESCSCVEAPAVIRYVAFGHSKVMRRTRH